MTKCVVGSNKRENQTSSVFPIERKQYCMNNIFKVRGGTLNMNVATK